ncbi:unnamed protein product, partial [marine sediment metagenome]
MEEQKKSIETISELVADGQLFDSKGFTIIKITKNGEEGSKKFPI